MSPSPTALRLHDLLVVDASHIITHAEDDPSRLVFARELRLHRNVGERKQMAIPGGSQPGEISVSEGISPIRHRATHEKDVSPRREQRKEVSDT